MDSDFAANTIFVAFAIIVGTLLIQYIIKIINFIYFHLTKDNINNEKLIVKNLEKRYNEEYPLNKSIEVCRPRKVYEYWTVFIENPSTTQRDESGNLYIKKHIFFFDGFFDKIKREDNFFFSSKKDKEQYRFISRKYWDRDGNEVDD